MYSLTNTVVDLRWTHVESTILYGSGTMILKVKLLLGCEDQFRFQILGLVHERAYLEIQKEG